MSKMYIMYDDRAVASDPDEASILDTAHDMDEVAESNRCHESEGYVWYEYDDEGNNLLNPVQRMDLHDLGLTRKSKRQRRR